MLIRGGKGHPCAEVRTGRSWQTRNVASDGPPAGAAAAATEASDNEVPRVGSLTESGTPPLEQRHIDKESEVLHAQVANLEQ